MKEYDEIVEDEKIEKDNLKSIQELSKYTKILTKGNNIFFIPNNKDEIKLKNSKSLFKISMLLGNLPEENVNFTIYIDQEDEQSEEKSKKSSTKKILQVPNNPPEIPSPSPIQIKNAEIKIEEQKDKDKEKDKDRVSSSPKTFYLTDDVKESVANEIYKNGNVIGYNHNYFKKVWKNLYKVTLLIASSNVTALSLYSLLNIVEKNYTILVLDGLSLATLSLMIFTSVSGNDKMQAKKKVNFTKENWLLFSFILMSISCIGCWGYLSKINFLTIYAYIIFGLLILMSIVLIYLNIKMINFYKEYHKLTEEGTLLVEVE